jgi:hypothetical protein
LAPQPSLDLGLLLLFFFFFWRLLNNFLFYRLGLLASGPTPNLEDQTSVFISPRGRVAQLYPQAPGTRFSCLLRHSWVTVGLFLFPGHHTGKSQCSAVHNFCCRSINCINSRESNADYKSTGLKHIRSLILWPWPPFNSYASAFSLPTQFNGFPSSPLSNSPQPEVNPQDREDEVDASLHGSSCCSLVNSTRTTVLYMKLNSKGIYYI